MHKYVCSPSYPFYNKIDGLTFVVCLARPVFVCTFVCRLIEMNARANKTDQRYTTFDQVEIARFRCVRLSFDFIHPDRLRNPKHFDLKIKANM